MDDVASQPRTSREHERLAEAKAREENWQRWGTYLPERQWGTVREDYSAEGDPWTSFTHDMARYRAYRWGEDGLLGWTDRQCRLCFSTSLWNGRDPILKERLFGLTNPEGNHGEDVKELYYYLDAVPTHAYAKALYKYPQAAFPYEDLVATNAGRGFDQGEYELLDTGVFDDDRYFDVTVEYAKAAVEDTLIRLTIVNRAPDPSDLCVLPTLTLRNNWSWRTLEPTTETRPWMVLRDGAVVANHAVLGRFRFEPVGDDHANREVLFTENDSNVRRLDPAFAGEQGYSKDAFDRFLVGGEATAVNPEHRGTKATFLHRLRIAPGDTVTLRLRLVREDEVPPEPLDVSGFEACFAERRAEADAFYATVIADGCSEDERAVSRQAYAGLLWSKQFYYYVAQRWLDGDPAQPAPPEQRATKAGDDWRHLFCRDVLSMPDKWEYPWFAAWDLAFHMIPMARIDPTFAKSQLLLLLRDWYLHPNGQLPAYEGSFGDVNPPVHALAVFQVYAFEARRSGHPDLDFLEAAFHKLLLNFTWWVNRNDDGHNLFGGGFLGLDNIGVFDRDMALPDGVTLSQADATAWMGLFCASMLRIAVELAQHRPIFQDIASKFFGHYIAIIDAINSFGGGGLWDEEEGFYFDQLATEDDRPNRLLKVHSIVGLVPLFAVVSLHRQELDKMPDFSKRMDWFLANKPHLASYVTLVESDDPALAGSHFLSLVPRQRLQRLFGRLFAEEEFLSPHGVRALSKVHAEHPYTIEFDGKRMAVRYVPAEGENGMFGGNSNWRGPVWFPINALLVNALHRYHAVYGQALTIECPTGSGRWVTLREAAGEIAARCVGLFLRDQEGRRPCHGAERRYRDDPAWRDLVLFNEYFCGDTGRGLGASHQTGWTALAATLIDLRHGSDAGVF